ncbi:MAG: tetratricopeptide repeat protein, partial [Spirochaetaceae bacterium]|nr:tetratricopeptide repeat protein [Spirochaetaceae bacterium]
MDIGQAAEPAGRASRAALEGRHEDAVRLYEEAVALAPNAAFLHYDLGLEYAEIGQVDEARLSLKEAVRL